MHYNIQFVPEGIAVDVREGTTLLEAEIAAGLAVDAPCGGRGACRKCAVEYRRAGDGEYIRALACQTRIASDMEVRRIDNRDTVRVLTDGAIAEPSFRNPLARPVRLRVPPCPRGRSDSDWSRLKAALSEALGPCEWRPSIAVCRDLGRLLGATKGEIWVVVSEDRVLCAADEMPRVLMAAFDLGTTTIAGYLIEADSGKTLAACGARNPQARFGADVISRADHALKSGVEALAVCVRDALQALVETMCGMAAEKPESIFAMSLAGNTAMHHLFLGIAPDSLVRAPYNPTVSEGLSLRACDFGLRLNGEARLYALPVIGGYVGADTVACLLSGGWRHREKLTLLIDIGTNGELVLGDGSRRVACSTAAGPALEGAKITCGMSAANGAIDRVWLEDGVLRWHVIGDAEARGLCGSGLVDLVAMLLQCGALDGSGRLEAGDRFELSGTGVFLSQKDVREVQLAKAAIAAGIRLMARRLGVTLRQIVEVDIAGAFGNYINPDNACAIGLIPAELRDRILPVGNAAGEGAKIALLDADRWRISGELARETEFLELATMPEFQDEFVEQLSFSDDDE